MKLLVVEDHAALGDMVCAHFRERGFSTDQAGCGADAIKFVAEHAYDAVILDLGLGDMDGLDVLRAIRGRALSVPTLILTARDRVEHRVAGLDAGADDYVLKPFDLAELEARLRAVLRRPGLRAADSHGFGDLRFEEAGRTAHASGRAMELTRREAAMLELLIRAGDRLVVRDTLADRLYGLDEDVSANALEATVSRLRRKLGALGSTVRIETVRGIGYRLRHETPA